MPVLEIGGRRVPYVVRRTARAQRRRIVVTPGLVEVIAPEAHSDDEIAAFMHRRRRWVHNQTERMAERVRHDAASPIRFVSGAKVLYRGRRLRLTVQAADVDEPRVSCRGGFLVEIPRASQSADVAVERALMDWLRGRAADDVAQIARRYAPRIGVAPAALRVKEQKHLWGSCGKDGSINIHWQLVLAPRPVLEYAVVHELCHLRERSHGPEFWRLLQQILPDYESRKGWLEENEMSCRWR
jgi:predicted metal-dependent hydrolase